MNTIKTFSLVTLFCSLFAFYAFQPAETPIVSEVAEINWMTFEEAVAANKKEPRKIMIDLYTDWCGWCKVMDKKTFNQESVANYVNQNFYAVKFNAEQKEDINFANNTFKYVAQGRKGYHQLAAALVDGKMSYPTIVYMSQDIERIMISPGFKEADALMVELTYAKEELYKTTAFNDYKATQMKDKK